MPASGTGPGVLTHAQVAAWADLRRLRLTAWEIDMLFDFDNRRLRELAERPKPQQQ